MTSSARALRRTGGWSVLAGSLLAVAGAGAWFAVTTQLRAERITIPGNAPALAGRTVQGPVSAVIEAQVIKGNAEKGAGGRTFADISEALKGVDGASDEAKALRGQSAALATAASLRTSLLTSVLAYGVSALVVGLGALFVVLGAQLRGAADD